MILQFYSGFWLPVPQFGFIPSSINCLIGFWAKTLSNLSNLCSENFIFENGTDFWKYNNLFCFKLSDVGFLWQKSNFHHLNHVICHSWLTNWLWVKKSAKTVKFRSWKLYLEFDSGFWLTDVIERSTRPGAVFLAFGNILEPLFSCKFNGSLRGWGLIIMITQIF